VTVTTVERPFEVQYRTVERPPWRPVHVERTLLKAAQYAGELFELGQGGTITATRFLDVDGTVMGGCGATWNQA
jgi:hypothetical protein